MAEVQFEDFSVKAKGALEDAIKQYLYDAAGELTAQVTRSSPFATHELEKSWTYVVDEQQQIATIGSPLENAIWNEFGTGEYALNGDGRKGGWIYKDHKDEWHHTFGKAPQRTFKKSFDKSKPKLIKRAEEVLKGNMK